MIFIGSDHGGFFLKEKINNYFKSNNIIFEDLGTHSIKSNNYVTYAKAVSEQVVKYHGVGILICSSGIGMSIAANKISGVRAALCTSNFHAEFSRRHNDANVICFGAKVSDENNVIEMINIFLNTPFDGGRHKIRVDSISDMEKSR